MLVLSRKLSQRIMIDGDITIEVVRISSNDVGIGITAPDGVSIKREELVGREPKIVHMITDDAPRKEVSLESAN